MGIGFEKAAKSITKAAETVVNNPRNEGLTKTKSQGSNRVGLYDHYSSDIVDNNDDNDDKGDNETILDDSNVNAIKFQAHDFHTTGGDNANANYNNFYKYYHFGKLIYKTEWCRIHVCRST